MDGSHNWVGLLLRGVSSLALAAVAWLGATEAADWQYGWWVVFGVVAVAVVLTWWLLRRSA